MNMFFSVLCLVLFFSVLPLYWVLCCIKYTFIINSFGFMDVARKVFVYPEHVGEKICLGFFFIVFYVPIWLVLCLLMFTYFTSLFICGWPGFVLLACRSLGEKSKR